MPETPTQKFHFRANAHVLSGQLTRPVQHTIEVQAATSLPTIGGVGRVRIDNFRFNEHVSFKAGYSHVSGVSFPHQSPTAAASQKVLSVGSAGNQIFLRPTSELN